MWEEVLSWLENEENALEGGVIVLFGWGIGLGFCFDQWYWRMENDKSRVTRECRV